MSALIKPLKLLTKRGQDSAKRSPESLTPADGCEGSRSVLRRLDFSHPVRFGMMRCCQSDLALRGPIGRSLTPVHNFVPRFFFAPRPCTTRSPNRCGLGWVERRASMLKNALK